MGWMTKVFGPHCTRCQRRTRNQVRGEAVCIPCQMAEQAQEEAVMECPQCGASMAKQIEQTVIYDKCPDCGGVWLDKSELETLVAVANAAGQGSGQAAGIMMGMAMAPHHSAP